MNFLNAEEEGGGVGVLNTLTPEKIHPHRLKCFFFALNGPNWAYNAMDQRGLELFFAEFCRNLFCRKIGCGFGGYSHTIAEKSAK